MGYSPMLQPYAASLPFAGAMPPLGALDRISGTGLKGMSDALDKPLRPPKGPDKKQMGVFGQAENRNASANPEARAAAASPTLGLSGLLGG